MLGHYAPFSWSSLGSPVRFSGRGLVLSSAFMTHKRLLPLALVVCALAASCTTVPTMPPGSVANAPPQTPPLFLPAGNDPNSELAVNERAMDVLHYYNFEVDTSNQLEGTLATYYKVGSGIIEPWHKESVGLANRLESTAQPIRRKVSDSFCAGRRRLPGQRRGAQGDRGSGQSQPELARQLDLPRHVSAAARFEPGRRPVDAFRLDPSRTRRGPGAGHAGAAQSGLRLPVMSGTDQSGRSEGRRPCGSALGFTRFNLCD